MMFPGSTFSPPNFLTPKYLGLESRPFFVDPAVFLVAQRLNTKLITPEDSVALAYTEAFEISSLTFTLLKIDEKAILLATGHLTCVSRRAAAAEDEPAAAAAALGEGTDDGVAAWGPAFALCCRQWT